MPESENNLEMPAPFGVFAETGELFDEITDETIQAFTDQGPDESEEQAALEEKADEAAHYGVDVDTDPNDLTEAGWAVLFAPGVDQKIKDALQPLLDHRKAQVEDESLFKVFDGPTGYRPGDTASAWLARHNVRMDVVDATQGVPYYIMLVGPPDEIPFEFQYGLDIYWAVGRLWFETPDEFRQYADSVIRYETAAEVPTSRQMALFSPRHDFDRATQLFCKQVSEPMANGHGSKKPIGQRQKFPLQSFIGEPASKETLHKIFTGEVPNGTPALLFSGSHGLGLNADDPRLADNVGALVCHDWPGSGGISSEHWFAAADLPANAKVHGMVHFLFACFGAGCPQFDNFDRTNNQPKQVAPKALLSRLPQALLAHPDGGALAVIGHVERAWAYGFQSSRGGPQIQGFRDVLTKVLKGDRLGEATDDFNMRWAALSTELTEVLNDVQFGADVSPRKLANQWVARDDARNYIIFGDPAVKLRVDDMPEIV